MNVMKTVILLIAILSLSAQAQESDRRAQQARVSKSTETATAEMNTVKATTATRAEVKTMPGQSGPTSLSAKPGTVLTLCCGSVDPHEMTGSNCAYMHTGQGCAGMILACPEGTKDTVTEDGSGYCKSGG